MASTEKVGKKWKGVARRMIHGERYKKSKTFASKKEAIAWAVETEKTLGTDLDASQLSSITYAMLINRYLHEITPTKKSSKAETLRLNKFIRDYPKIAKKNMAELSKHDVARWKDDRLKKVSPSTVSREWSTLSAVITSAQFDWGLPIAVNPFRLIRKPKEPPPRNQRVTDDDIELFMQSFNYDRLKHPLMQKDFAAWAFLFAIETAMRVSEICRLDASDVKDKLAHLRETKNGDDRYVPLSKEALRLLSLVDLPIDTTPQNIDVNFRKYRPPELRHINFHDSRHEALTRMADKIHNPMTLAKISGHKDIKILLNTYYNPKGDDLSGLLD